MRLQKYIAMCGAASRRKAEELIRQGRIIVNGETVCEMGFPVNEKDTVLLDGRQLLPEEQKFYIMLNKPKGFVTTAKDQFGRATVLDLVKGLNARVYPVGRLDYDTTGLLILTNDGEFVNMVTHPGNKIEKVYEVTSNGCPDAGSLEKLRNGIDLGDFKTAPAKVQIISEHKNNSGKAITRIRIIIGEGKNRQVRRMFAKIGFPVLKLHRVATGGLQLGSLKPGEYKFMDKEEAFRVFLPVSF